jgi:protein-S-isoprenylcysteine O-methyltransferase Ste14
MAVRFIAVLCSVLALAGASAFGGFVLLLGCDLFSPRPFISWPSSLFINLSWLAAFAVQHSGMAREVFKRRWFVPAALERSVYAALAGVLLLLLPLVWQPLPGPVLWRAPLGLVVLPLLAAAGVALINLRYDPAGMFGVRQAWAGDQPGAPEPLIVTGPYRFVRHPLMSCVLVFLWAQPAMTPTLLLLSGGLTLYVLLGTALEERDLLRRFQPDYAAYRRRVPAFVPWRHPVEGPS